MPRDLPLANGTLLVNFDLAYQLRDIYFPHVGQENQTDGHPSRFGVWVDGHFSWTSDPAWQREMRFRPDTMVSAVRLTHPDLGLVLECDDAVDFHENVLLRQCTVINQRPTAREVRLFYHHDFHLYGTDLGDTAMFDPRSRTVIQYKRERWLLINTARLGPDPQNPTGPPVAQPGVESWATGNKEVAGAEGTWRDAEDGVLGCNPIAQGSVDSVVQITLQVPPADPASNTGATALLWLCAAKNYSEVRALDARVRGRLATTLIQRTADYWHLWANEQDYDYGPLPGPLVDLFKTSLLVVRTQIDDSGAVTAANDADVTTYGHDTYSYMWPRDGALVSYALAAAGYRTTVRRFFDFCARVITDDGYLLHKYNPDGSLASSWHPWEVDGTAQLPIQEDETALVIWALWQWFDHARNVEDVKPWYRPLIIAGAEFMVRYVDAETGLPEPSYDLWEERRGVFAWTAGAVYGGLEAAAEFADAFGETAAAERYREAAVRVRDAVARYLYHDQEQRFVRGVTRAPDGSQQQDLTVDASMTGLFYFGMFPPDDPRIVRTMQAIKERLWVNTPVGGLARYENDGYQRQSAAVPGNPWFVCTLWYAQWLIATACTEEDLQQALPLLHWVHEHALPSGVMAEQVHPNTGAPLSVSPLTWSHASYIAAVVEYLDKLSELRIDPVSGVPQYFRERHSLRHQHQHHATLRQMGVVGDASAAAGGAAPGGT